MFGVQVVTNDGGDVSGRRAIGRALAFPLSFLILCLGFLGILPERLRLRPSSSLLTWSFPLAYAILSMLTQGPAVT
jgi:hypothetical protein